MSKIEIEIDTCPECKSDIREKLTYLLLGRLRGNNFDFECECGAILEINVVPIPEFEVSVKERRPTQDALDDCPRCGGRGTVRNEGFVWVACPACSGNRQ